MTELKQVILVNGWLEMPTGKLAAQVSHASMAFLTNALRQGLPKRKDKVDIHLSLDIEWYDNWLMNGSFAKLVLVIRSEQEWEQIKTRMDKYGLQKNTDYFEIIDHGRTVFNGERTHTCTGFTPMTQSQINKLFGSLPLLK